MNIKKNIPTVATVQGKPCPVCGLVSYSLGGIHPQCSYFRSDKKTLARRKKVRAHTAVVRRK